MFINNFDPVAFTIFSFEIRWYSMAYIFRIIIGWFYCVNFLINDDEMKKKFEDFISFLIIGIILGGRIGYICFYNTSYYFENPIETIKIWKGGMSFHGAVIGILLASYIFTKNNKVNNFKLLDLISAASPIGIFFGRISNFINSELYGKTTDFFLSVKFVKIDNLYRHPSQLYEAFFEGIILFIILKIFYKKYNKYPGKVSAIFLIVYSLFRFLIEFVREPDHQLGYLFFNLSMGQLLSIIFFTFGAILFIRINEKK